MWPTRCFFSPPITRGGLRASPSIRAAALASKLRDQASLRRATSGTDRFAVGEAAAGGAAGLQCDLNADPRSAVVTAGHDAAVDIPHCAGNPGCLFREQENDNLGHVGWRTYTSDRVKA